MLMYVAVESWVSWASECHAILWHLQSVATQCSELIENTMFNNQEQVSLLDLTSSVFAYVLWCRLIIIMAIRMAVRIMTRRGRTRGWVSWWTWRWTAASRCQRRWCTECTFLQILRKSEVKKKFWYCSKNANLNRSSD